MKLNALALSLLLAAGPVAAAPMEVVSVQLPAWVQRGAGTTPLTPGMTLKADDVVRTGTGARVQLKMEEGSTIKLGENANLRLGAMGTAAENKKLFKAALQLAAGAIRFTTDARNKSSQRDVSVKIASVTAGIRGTDLWGKADGDKTIVCLIEGRIQIEKEGTELIAMEQPLTYYIPSKQGEPLMVAVQEQQLKQWAAETDMIPGQAITSTKGGWMLQAASVDSKGEAMSWYDNLRHAGYPAKIRSGRAEGKPVYRLVIDHLTDESAAHALAQRLKIEFNLSRPVAVQVRF